MRPYSYILRAAQVGTLTLTPGTSRPSAAPSPVRVVELRTEYLSNPLAIDTRAPRMSWVLLAPGLRGVTQSAYQIEVASTAANLAADKADLWNSGKVTSDRQNQIVFAARPLTSREQVFWKVRIWDQSGRRSAWSEPATWGMGLLDRGEWSAQWIGDATPSTTNVAATALRRRFMLAARPARAIVYASALGVYELHVNGQRVGDHVLRASSPTIAPGDIRRTT